MAPSEGTDGAAKGGVSGTTIGAIVASKATADALAGVHAYKKLFFVEVAKQFTDETYPAQATIDVTFDDSYQLPLAGGAQISLRRLQHAGISSTQTVAYAPTASGGGALFVGDLVHHGAHAWLEGGIVDGAPRPDLASWIGRTPGASEPAH